MGRDQWGLSNDNTKHFHWPARRSILPKGPIRRENAAADRTWANTRPARLQFSPLRHTHKSSYKVRPTHTHCPLTHILACTNNAQPPPPPPTHTHTCAVVAGRGSASSAEQAGPGERVLDGLPDGLAPALMDCFVPQDIVDQSLRLAAHLRMHSLATDTVVWLEVGHMTRAVLDAVCEVYSITVVWIEAGATKISFHFFPILRTFCA
jgi:hypothetical protein